ncbi:UbiH/UbiF family hydroxylase [Bartonella doshiae]|uniref:2-octaprenyl-3-methyl-6-methoxy-1,4-benzoquinol hydroxylase n=2 Tax=Bartonella doshiae TaxID=33044 RepID=A0A380ZIT5_BARDO|nr:UbiH/UbiF family hydroxylase [Bartonella doshiae]EJF82201.1 UbiH/UbiF/VisC/COQ6 family ubiquinone biosynthesis hydroxylase [Bartonella doshiae NCTC 12862 = ATCC 700133]MBB6159573.1 2-octaprenyl-6-methoxyphenol hydroxylase [Bartonella doshiae]SUV44886.1 2-octaprenyl-3-methyl-6-methoxy-1,4-benzoquinol hydroxylase [Bartonella doshiae]
MIFEKNKHRDIAVIGAGPVGMLAALSLANKGYSVFLVGPPAHTDELRTTALMMPAIRTLQKLNIWDTLKRHAASLSFIKIIDITSRIVRAPTVSFSSAEIGEEAFGYNIPNIELNNALLKAVAHTPNITRFFSSAKSFHYQQDHVCVTLADDSAIQVLLLIAADGRFSPTRTAAGIAVKQWSYPQTALVLNFSHDFSHKNTSTEFHTENGPFTQVPLLGNRSSLVWVVSTSRAKELLSIGSKVIAKVIEDKMQSMLGKLTLETPVQAWPLSGLIPHHFAANRTILMGEAAHVFPPIGAQGLNLGFRDIQTFIDILPKQMSDSHSKMIVAHYNRSRKSDIWIRSGSVHVLNSALLSNMLPVHIMRSIGLGLLRNCSPLRNLFMREGMYPGSGLKEIIQMFPIKLPKQLY